MKKLWNKYIRLPLQQWWHSLLARLDPPAPPSIPDAPPDTPTTPASPPAGAAPGDEVDIAGMRWAYGGFNGASAVLDVPRIGNLRMGRNLAYVWINGSLSVWGLAHDQAGALACLFVRQSNGTWVGGKFDWISSSRTTRDFANLDGYKGWTLTGVPNPCRAAFVIVSADGSRRTNIIATDWSR